MGIKPEWERQAGLAEGGTAGMKNQSVCGFRKVLPHAEVYASKVALLGCRMRAEVLFVRPAAVSKGTTLRRLPSALCLPLAGREFFLCVCEVTC